MHSIDYSAPCGSVMGVQDADPRSSKELRKWQKEIDMVDLGEISDGYHTFNELYDHRVTLFIALCRLFERGHDRPDGHGVPVWRAKLHADGTSFDGWFVMGLFKERGYQITYHLPLSRWDETNFADTLDRAPEWDGHTSADVIARLKDL